MCWNNYSAPAPTRPSNSPSPAVESNDISTSYSYRVRAYNAGGNSAYSNIASATTPKR